MTKTHDKKKVKENVGGHIRKQLLTNIEPLTYVYTLTRKGASSAGITFKTNIAEIKKAQHRQYANLIALNAKLRGAYQSLTDHQAHAGSKEWGIPVGEHEVKQPDALCQYFDQNGEDLVWHWHEVETSLMVREAGLEPARPKTQDFKSCAATDYATRAPLAF